MENNVSKTVFVRLAGMWNSGEQFKIIQKGGKRDQHA